MYSMVAKTKHHFAEGCSLSKLFSLAVEIRLNLSTMARSFSPLKPLPQLSFREPREPSSPGTLQQLALNAVQNPGETARQFLPPWHSVRKELEGKEFTDNRKKWQKEHAKKFRYVVKEFKEVEDLNWTWSLFPSHVALLVRLRM